MADKRTLALKLIELLAGVEFDQRYYGFYDAHQSLENISMPGAGLEDFKAALAATSLDFTYHKKEKFFSHTEAGEHCTVGLNVAFPRSTVEFILSVKTKYGDLGDPFAALALEVGQFRDPDFNPSPEFPKLPFSDEANLLEAVKFGVALFLDAKRAISSYDGWND